MEQAAIEALQKEVLGLRREQDRQAMENRKLERVNTVIRPF